MRSDNIPVRQEKQSVEQPIAKSTPSKTVLYISDKQKGMIQAQLKRIGKDMDWLVSGLKVRYGVDDYHDLSITEASTVISGLISMKDEQLEESVEEITESDMDKMEEEGK